MKPGDQLKTLKDLVGIDFDDLDRPFTPNARKLIETLKTLKVSLRESLNTWTCLALQS
jgi:hypothetical protein